MTFLSRIEKFSETPAPSGVAEVVDLKRLASRVELTGGLADWNHFDKTQLRSQLVDFAVDDIEAGSMTLAGFVKVPSDPQTRVAYAYSEDPQASAVAELRLWMAPGKDGRWKLYDWERLDLGLAESVEIGVYCRYAETRQLDSYYTLSDHLEQADVLIQQRDYSAAGEQLKMAENTSVAAEFTDLCHVLTAYRWQQLDDYENARACFERIRQPENTPGAFFGLLNCTEYDEDEIALKNANQYETCVGPSVNLCSRKAQLLERLDRHKDAVTEWQKVLRIDADNVGALAALLKDFSDENKVDLTPYLERLEDPVMVATRVINYLDADDQSGRTFLLDFVRVREPDSARSEAMVADSLHAAGQLEESAKHYEAAMSKEQDEDSQAEYVTEYLNLMLELGRILEATQRVSDKSEAYEYLLMSYEDDDILLSNDERLEVTRRYYDEYPNNGWAAFYRAQAIYESDEPEATIELLEKYLKSASEPSVGDEEYLESSVRLLLAKAQLAAGHDSTSLLAADPENFSPLANSALADERWDVVTDLIAARNTTDANDLDLLRLQGKLAIHEQRWDDAIAAFSTATEIATTVPEQSYLNWEFIQLLRTAYLNSGQWKRFYEEQDDKRQGFSRLARDLISRRDWSTIRELTETHQRSVPLDPQIPQLKSEVEWLLADYAACVKSCDAACRNPERDEEHALSKWQQTRLRFRQLACLLQLRRHSEANKLAQQIMKDDQDPATQTIVAAAEKDVAKMRRLALETFEQTESLQEVYSHSQVGPFILQEQFSDLHERCPVQISYIRESDKSVLLFDKPPTLSTQIISELVKTIAPKEQATVEEVHSSNPNARMAIAVRLRDSTIQIVSAEGQSDDWKLTHPDPKITPIISASTGSLTISNGVWSSHPQRETSIARKLAIRLADGSTGAIISSDWHMRFVRPDSPALVIWADTGFLPPTDLPEIREKESPDHVEPTREFQNTLRAIVMSESATSPTAFEVRCQIGSLQLGELLWIEVQEARHISYGNCEFQGVLKSTSKVLPTMRAGLMVTVNQWQVRAWRQDGGPVNLHPQHPGFSPPPE